MSDEGEQFGEPEFLGWYILVRLKGQSKDQISRSKFLKLCCIADRFLIEELGYDIGLPRYWYMYGELANEHEFSGRFYNAPKAIGWDGQQYLPKRTLTADDFDIKDEGVRRIASAVEWTIQNYGQKNVEEIQEDQYQNQAPNEFIRKYSEFRWLLQTIDLGAQQRLNRYTSEGESNEEYIRSILDEMVELYPTDEDYQRMQPLYLRWDDTVRMMLEGQPDYGEIEEFLDYFIEILSKTVLRFEYHRNISESRLDSWREDAQEDKSEFEDLLHARRRALLRRREQSSELDSISETYSATVRDDIQRILLGQ